MEETYLIILNNLRYSVKNRKIYVNKYVQFLSDLYRVRSISKS